jgi:hypothetical protein
MRLASPGAAPAFPEDRPEACVAESLLADEDRQEPYDGSDRLGA